MNIIDPNNNENNIVVINIDGNDIVNNNSTIDSEINMNRTIVSDITCNSDPDPETVTSSGNTSTRCNLHYSALCTGAYITATQ